MSCTKFISLFSIAFILQTAIAADPLFSICSSSGNFSDYSPYEPTLNKLLTFLYVKAPATGFALHTIATTDTVKVNGLTLCRGDISSSECQSCIAKANNDIRVRCPNHKEAIIWYDFCLLKYSDKNFFGNVDNQNKVWLTNVNDVKGVDPVKFNGKTRDLLKTLAGEAYANTTSFYAGGDTEILEGGSIKVYGMVQCTRDLSRLGCKECLEEAIAQLPNGKQGGRVVGGSCTVRYEIYSFLFNHLITI